MKSDRQIGSCLGQRRAAGVLLKVWVRPSGSVRFALKEQYLVAQTVRGWLLDVVAGPQTVGSVLKHV